MADSASENTNSSLIQLKVPQLVSPLPETFLERLVTELNNEAVTALVLVGSYARGNAPCYSDVEYSACARKHLNCCKMYFTLSVEK